jgi:Ser/Thr protein kinase RdoA (MazF antagonist)
MTDFYNASDAEQRRALAALADVALDHWGLVAHSREIIKYRENAVFDVKTEAGQRYALRIHRAGYHSNDALASELAWMDALREAAIDVPDIVRSPQGERFVVLSTPEVPEPRQIDIFEWIEGKPLGSVEEGLTQDVESLVVNYRTMGRLAATIHNQAVQWALPAHFVRHAWDADNLAGDRPFWGPFWALESLSVAQRDLLLRAKAVVYRDLQAFGQTADNYSLIHADFVPENIMQTAGALKLIDFDDAGFGWHLFELATALYFLHTEPFYPRLREALLEGYRQCRPLSEADEAALPLFMLARSFTYLGWVHTRPETETAREFTPVLVEMSCNLAETYLRERSDESLGSRG